MSIGFVLLAAGKGNRFKSATLKQFCKLRGRPVYEYPLQTATLSCLFDTIIVVVPAGYNIDFPHTVIGGKERRDSSLAGIQRCMELGIEYVVIHDACRPLVSERILTDHCRLVKSHGAVNTVIDSPDTINIIEKGCVSAIPPRWQCKLGQTPQSFSTKLIHEAHLRFPDADVTDDCGLVLAMGHPVTLVQGEEKNRKLTTQGDFEILCHIMKKELNQKKLAV
ncbi:MAG: hypothetical protein A3F09_00165 [Chlamydiae bacterium RIFCSPHIGHO2_12_FULL_49_11]|nr:MAG: hypothetical protein A3F09_00165 [Chlamydiae bacterium RIFCSPHIGHO2_12_FULL_49_11]